MHRPDDHRELNRDLHLFATDSLAGAGLPLWLPAGTAVRDELERLAKDLARADGCLDVHTPVLGKRSLFERSGHVAKFADDMLPPMRLGSASPEGQADDLADDLADEVADEVGTDLMLRPANCPHHALVYAASRHSYRELPIRLNELGPMFRAERSGVLSGLTRVRQIALDDTHVFCRPDQAGAEAARGLRAALTAQRVLGLPVDHVRLSTRDDGDGWLGSEQQWAEAQHQLRVAGRQVLDDRLELREVAGEAAFYGPKFDLQVRGDGGREETIATVQLDFNQPARFGLTYDGADGERHPVLMIHRGTVGSMERVVAALVEHYRGRLSFWLAPVQVSVLPVGSDQDEAARGLRDALYGRRLRPELSADGSLGSRVRRARIARHAVIAVLGPREAADGTVQLTDVAADARRTLPVPGFLDLATTAHRDRRRHLLTESNAP